MPVMYGSDEKLYEPVCTGSLEVKMKCDICKLKMTKIKGLKSKYNSALIIEKGDKKEYYRYNCACVNKASRDFHKDMTFKYLIFGSTFITFLLLFFIYYSSYYSFIFGFIVIFSFMGLLFNFGRICRD